MTRIFKLRVEEVIALVFLLPTTYLTVVANVYARRVGELGDRYPGGVVRLAVAAAFLAGLALAHRRWPRSPLVKGLREVLPFLTCILIYTNLHDTIGFVNPNDIHDVLAALDRELFGVIPAVWAERFITPARTEVMSFLYINFFWIAPSTSLLLLLRRRLADFRTATMGVLVCFFLGYFLYVLFPAAPPRLVLLYEFKRNLQGYPFLMSNLSAQAFSLLPVDSRAAFPSLHAAVSLVALVYAWRFVRPWFWVLLPFCLGLWVSTVYLRHHFVVDLIAGWALAPVAVWAAPRLDGWWAARQAALGYATARGARRPEARRPAVALALLTPLVLVAASASASAAPGAGEKAEALTAVERSIVAHVEAESGAAVALLQRVVDINSGTQNVEGVRAVGEVFRQELARLGFEARLSEPPPETGRGPHLIAERPGTRGRRLLLIGHLDTVFERDDPFQRWQPEGAQARGPGTVDMKGGDVIVVFALRALHAAGALEGARVAVVFTGDEEDPGPLPASRRELVEIARRSDAALGFEATATGMGEATVARRGASEWLLSVQGTSAHSSAIFGERVGAGAVFEASRILKAFYDELGDEPNLTFNPGLVLGGSEVSHDPRRVRGSASGKTNIVAPAMKVQGDLRFLSDEQLRRARGRMRRIVEEGRLPGTAAEISFSDVYPAMEPRERNYALLDVLDGASRALGQGGVAALDPGRRGAGDVSFVAAHVACLDGLGAMGAGAHTGRETVDLESLPALTKRAAVLIHRLTR